MERLDTRSCEEIMTTVYKPIEFVVENLIAQGLYILAGAPKIGKSWLSLDICLSIAKGEKVLEHETKCGTALYLCLEDSFERIQKRLYDLTDEPTENLYFAIMSDAIGSGLENQIKKFKSEHSDLKMVVIDTLQKIRESTENSYGSDYKELSVLKSLADKLGIAIVLVHHTRKCSDSDPFNMISGSTGLSGCVDGSMVLVETKRGSRKAKLHCVGRDIENAEINLHFDSDLKKWIVTDEPTAPKSKDNTFLAAVYLFIKVKIHFEGSATELVKQLKFVSDEEFHSNRVTRDLVQNGYEMSKYGIDFKHKRTHSGRIICLDYCVERDGSDGKNGSVVTVTKRLAEVSQTSV
ncbi:MAG: helicase RepA family protein [Ruminococcus flavefaciens]|nr:helicase RepA family protein [Ruminococcus flavefaciens]